MVRLSFCRLALFCSLLALGVSLTGCGTSVNGTSGQTGSESGSGSSGSLSSIQHVVFMAQENRSLDSYLGTLRQYWAQNGYPDQSFDGLPQFNPASGIAPLQGAAPAIPGCDPNSPPPSDCSFDTGNPVTTFHLKTMCIENPSPSWNESHVDWDYSDPVGLNPATNNGFVWTAAHDARTLGYYDTNGVRAMGYYNGGDLNYLYFMASNFGTSDRFFNPAMSRTNINREYLLAATSGGYAYPNGTDAADTPQLQSQTIFQELQNAGISWKIYVDTEGSSCTGPPYQASCLMTLSYLQNFTYAQTVVNQYPQNIAPMSQYFAGSEQRNVAAGCRDRAGIGLGRGRASFRLRQLTGRHTDRRGARSADHQLADEQLRLEQFGAISDL